MTDFKIKLGGDAVLRPKMQNAIIRPPIYTGETLFIPKNEEQTINTAQTYVEDDIVVGAIPQEYGLITFTAVVPTFANIMVS